MDTGSKRSRNPEGETSNAPRMLTPSEIESLRQDKAQVTDLVTSQIEKLCVPKSVDELPTQGVADYVARLATQYHVDCRPTAHDEWAQAATPVVCEEVEVDETDLRLIRLKQRNVLNDEQFTWLVLNHHREQALLRKSAKP